jgi:hypothetical protein
MGLYDDSQGILDPNSQLWLGMATGLMKAGGASPYPVSFGQALGQGLESGMANYNQAQKARQEQAMQAQRAALLQEQVKQAQQQSAFNDQMSPMMQNPGGYSPDAIEQVGMRAGVAGHPGAATLLTIAQKMRERQEADKQFQQYKSAEDKPGLFADLTDSPYVGQQAKALQARLDASNSGNPAEVRKEYDRLQNIHIKMADAAEKGLSDVGKLRADLKAGRITQEDFDSSMAAKGRGPGVTNPDNLRGPDYLKSLDPTTANIVKKIGDYELNPQTLSNRAGERKQILAHVAEYNPGYDQTKFASRNALRKEFTSGKMATNVTAINTAIGHLQTLDSLYDAMQNGDAKAANAIVNTIRDQTGDPRVNNAGIAIGAVSNELMRVFRQVGASETEIKDWEKRFTTSMSKGQSKGAIKTSAELLESRINAVNDQWDRGMESKGGYPNLVSPKSAQFLAGMKTPSTGGGWTDDKERRYQELLRKQRGS